MGRLISTLEDWDKALFQVINGAHNSFFDFLMPWISDKYVWIPLYALILFWMYKDSKIPIWQILISIIVLITVSDQLASGILKPWVERLRPCYDPELKSTIQLLKGCGGQYGFALSHSSNSFAIAIFTWLLLRDKKPLIWLLIIWASVVAYSRVYLGVHYLGDILAGAIIGIGAGYFVYFILKILNRSKSG